MILISARNGVAISPPSRPSRPVTQSTAPSALKTPSTRSTRASLQVTWKSPASRTNPDAGLRILRTRRRAAVDGTADRRVGVAGANGIGAFDIGIDLRPRQIGRASFKAT